LAQNAFVGLHGLHGHRQIFALRGNDVFVDVGVSELTRHFGAFKPMRLI
jgi:hypothetical protein